MDDLLPQTGIYTAQGNLFYHEKPLKYTKEAKKRLAEFGIETNVRSQFTLEEHCLVLKNWKRYAESIGYPVENAPIYLNAGHRHGALKKDMEERYANNFYVELCRGLPHRSAFQVYKKALEILDPNILEDHKKWDDDEMLFKLLVNEFFFSKVQLEQDIKFEIIKLHEKKRTARHIAQELELKIRAVRSFLVKYNKINNSNKSVVQSLIWKTVIPKIISTEEFAEALKSNKLDQFARDLDFKHIAAKLFILPKIALRAWNEYISDIKQSFVELKKTNNEKYAVKVVMRGVVVDKLSRAKQRVIMACVCKLINRHTQIFDKNEFKKSEFKKMMKEKGIWGYRKPGQTLMCSLLHNTRQRLSTFNRFVFDKLAKGFPVRLKIHCLYWAMCRKTDWKDGRIYELLEDKEQIEVIQMNLTNTTMRFLQNDFTKKWLEEELKLTDLDVFELATEAFVIYSHYTYGDNFIFPSKLHGFVKSEVVKPLLCKENNNSEYLNPDDIEIEGFDGALEKKLKQKLTYREYMEDGEPCEIVVKQEIDDEFEVVETIRKREVNSDEIVLDEIEEASTSSRKRKRTKRSDSEDDNETLSSNEDSKPGASSISDRIQDNENLPKEDVKKKKRKKSKKSNLDEISNNNKDEV